MLSLFVAVYSLFVIIITILLFVGWTAFVTHGVMDYWIDMKDSPFVWEAVVDLCGAVVALAFGYTLLAVAL